MRLYLSGFSKNHIGYTPDTLIVYNGKKRYEYDIQGTTDYSPSTLSTRTKGYLSILNEKKDDYFRLNKTGYSRLAKLLKDPATEVIISVYPVNNPPEEDVNSDIISETVGTLITDQNEEVSFRFFTEFYGY